MHVGEYNHALVFLIILSLIRSVLWRSAHQTCTTKTLDVLIKASHRPGSRTEPGHRCLCLMSPRQAPRRSWSPPPMGVEEQDVWFQNVMEKNRHSEQLQLVLVNYLSRLFVRFLLVVGVGRRRFLWKDISVVRSVSVLPVDQQGAAADPEATAQLCRLGFHSQQTATVVNRSRWEGREVF